MTEGADTHAVGESPPSALLNTVVVRFRVPGDMAQLDAGDLDLQRNDQVVVETERGPCLATVLMPPEPNHPKEKLRRVLRRVTPEDIQVESRNAVREREAFRFCLERIKALDLPMKLISVDLAHTGTRALFNFTSAQRVDFRALVKDLARRFHTRIEMRQIGVRDAARHTGGTGLCGREVCCSTWLPQFKPISIRMAKDQNLALNHDKLSGVCGRLRCCLRYEQELYQQARKGLPKMGKRVITPLGEGRVKEINVLRRRVRVQLVAGGYAELDADEVQRPTDVGPSRPAKPIAPGSANAPTPAAQPSPAMAATPADGAATDSATTDGAAPKRRRRRRGRRRRGKGKADQSPDNGATARTSSGGNDPSKH